MGIFSYNYARPNFLDNFFKNSRSGFFLYLLIGFLFIFVPVYYYVSDISVDSNYRRADATGFNHGWGKEFIYFYYYKGLFPLASADTNKVFSVQGAEASASKRPLDLRMEWGHWSRFGESARIWLYMPYCWLKGSAKNPQITFTVFLLHLLVIQLSHWIFYLINKPFSGVIFNLIFCCTPFMVYEVYCNNNVFGLMSIFSVFLFLAHLPVIVKKVSVRYVLLIGAVCGFFSAIMHNIRAESLPMMASCIFIYLTYHQWPWYRRFLPVLFLLSLFFLTDSVIQNYFLVKKNHTTEYVKKVGGVPFEGGATIVHPFWHPIFCGLGDYDKKYHHYLHDTFVYNYALPILRKLHNEEYKYPGKTPYEMNEFYDSTHYYYKKAETLPGFDSIVKQKFLSDVGNDPAWYGGLILSRTRDFFFNLSPLGISLNNLIIPVPFHGIIFFCLIFLVFVNKDFRLLKILLFLTPLASSVILIYSAYNSSYQSIFHYITFALLLDFLASKIFIAKTENIESKAD